MRRVRRIWNWMLLFDTSILSGLEEEAISVLICFDESRLPMLLYIFFHSLNKMGYSVLDLISRLLGRSHPPLPTRRRGHP
jgi:hypothetical protein